MEDKSIEIAAAPCGNCDEDDPKKKRNLDRRCTIGAVRSEESMSRALGSLRSQSGFMEIKDKTSLALIMILSIIVPIAWCIVSFIGPACSFRDDLSCHQTSRRFYRWVAGVGAVSSIVCVAHEMVESVVIKRLYNERIPPSHKAFLTIAEAPFVVIAIELLQLIHPNFPFIYPICMMCAFVPWCCLMGIYLYKKCYISHPNLRADLFQGSVYVFIIANCALLNVLIYVGYGIVYRNLEDMPVWNFIWSVFGLTITREVCNYSTILVWNRFHRVGFMITQTFVLLVHALTLTMLRGGSDGSLFKIVVLSLTDFSSIVASFYSLHYEDKKSIPDDAKILSLTMYIILEELVEVLVPPIYGILATFFYYHPNGLRIAGIGTTEFGLEKIPDITTFQLSIFYVWLTELLTFAFCGYVLMRHVKVNIVATFSHYLHEHAALLIFDIVTAFTIIFAIQFLPFGADLNFKFSWL